MSDGIPYGIRFLHERPDNPAVGDIIFNEDKNRVELFLNSGYWLDLCEFTDEMKNEVDPRKNMERLFGKVLPRKLDI